MSYLLRGRLCGLICDDCDEALAGAAVRLYRPQDPERVTELAAARTKETLALVDDDQLQARQPSLLGEGVCDANGAFSIALADGYDGGAVEVDVRLETVPGARTSEQAHPRQLAITTVQPRWREGDGASVASFEYCIPNRIWCLIRGLFGAWTICGHVTVCATGRPVPGVRVFAIDADWLQDDPLGNAITDAAGHFRIDYTPADFERTPFSWLHLELVPGPDVYFRVETPGGAPLLVENRSQGRTPGRENVGPCLCVGLCLSGDIPPGGGGDPVPAFTAIGAYRYDTQVASHLGQNGRTLGDDRAFFSELRLNGILAKHIAGVAMEYRFEACETDAAGNLLGSYTAIAPTQVARTDIGTWEYFDLSGPTLYTKRYTVNGTPGPDELVASWTADGFVRVPQEDDPYSPGGDFVPNGNMIELISQSLAAWGTKDETGVAAGGSAAGAGGLAGDRYFSLRLMVRQQGDSSNGSQAGTCVHVAIDNTLYDHVSHHPAWNPHTDNGQLAVCLVDVAELEAAPCSLITNQLHVPYTAAHPNLGSVSLTLTGPGGSQALTLVDDAGATAQNRYGTVDVTNVATLPKCAYLLTLAAQVLLTTGDGVPNDLYDQIAFCKG
jgi:hypothetical protein